MSPLVSCICPTTAARRAWLPQAVRCFLAQAYERCELLIVTSPGDVAALPEELSWGHPRIRLVRSFRGLSLGEKRNVANACAAGEILAHWDDDDWSYPGRLAEQVARLEETGKAVTGYSRMLFSDGREAWRYSDANYPLGTSLCYRRAWWEVNAFPDMAVASDNPFIAAARQQRQLDVIECGERMFARDHGGNTNKRVMGGSNWIPVNPLPEVIAREFAR